VVVFLIIKSPVKVPPVRGKKLKVYVPKSLPSGVFITKLVLALF